MVDSTLSDDLELARQLASVAADIALARFARGVATRIKPDGSPVTDADTEVERALRAILAEQRPQDAVLGEELGASGSARRVWILDPIDGTAGFVAGRGDWGTHVALQVDGEVALGVITRPTAGRTWWARRGGGAYRTDADGATTRLCVSRVAQLSESRASSWAKPDSESAARLRRAARWVAPDFDDILRVAQGELEVAIDPFGKAWDHAPVVILVEEAGGCFSDSLGGRRVDRGEVRFTNGLVHGELQALLASR